LSRGATFISVPESKSYNCFIAPMSTYSLAR
jgi:hypothetical protein